MQITELQFHLALLYTMMILTSGFLGYAVGKLFAHLFLSVWLNVIPKWVEMAIIIVACGVTGYFTGTIFMIFKGYMLG